jgi:thiol-disulfide isomerase/thioredoxin
MPWLHSWCAPCKQLSPLLERIEGDPSLIGARALDLVTLKAGDVPSLSAEYKVSASPGRYSHIDQSRSGTCGADGLCGQKRVCHWSLHWGPQLAHDQIVVCYLSEIDDIPTDYQYSREKMVDAAN